MVLFYTRRNDSKVGPINQKRSGISLWPLNAESTSWRSSTHNLLTGYRQVGAARDCLGFPEAPH